VRRKTTDQNKGRRVEVSSLCLKRLSEFKEEEGETLTCEVFPKESDHVMGFESTSSKVEEGRGDAISDSHRRRRRRTRERRGRGESSRFGKERDYVAWVVGEE